MLSSCNQLPFIKFQRGRHTKKCQYEKSVHKLCWVNRKPITNFETQNEKLCDGTKKIEFFFQRYVNVTNKPCHIYWNWIII